MTEQCPIKVKQWRLCENKARWMRLLHVLFSNDDGVRNKVALFTLKTDGMGTNGVGKRVLMTDDITFCMYPAFSSDIFGKNACAFVWIWTERFFYRISHQKHNLIDFRYLFVDATVSLSLNGTFLTSCWKKIH